MIKSCESTIMYTAKCMQTLCVTEYAGTSCMHDILSANHDIRIGSGADLSTEGRGSAVDTEQMSISTQLTSLSHQVPRTPATGIASDLVLSNYRNLPRPFHGLDSMTSLISGFQWQFLRAGSTKFFAAVAFR